MALLEVESLSKSYRVGTSQLSVLRGLDLSVDTGEMVAIVGASGIGKSTLMHVLGGLDRIDAGRIQVDKTEITRLKDDELVAFRNRKIGFVFQFHHLLPEFNAQENTQMPLRIAGVPPVEARARSETLLAQVGLSGRATHRPGMLSGGEQQRVAVARALVMKPALLLADEPTGDLDEHTGNTLYDLLRVMHARHGLTSLIATHNMKLASSCDRVLRLAEGRLLAA